MQNQLLEDEQRKNEVLVEESRNHSLQKTEALYQLEAVDQTRKSYEASSGSLREELKVAQVSDGQVIAVYYLRMIVDYSSILNGEFTQ